MLQRAALVIIYRLFEIELITMFRGALKLLDIKRRAFVVEEILFCKASISRMLQWNNYTYWMDQKTPLFIFVS